MKKTITILIAFILSISIYAQSAPEKFTYQAVVRNADNTLAISQDVGIRISILKTTSSGAVAYEETHTPTTNANGLLTIKIGEGDNKTGSISSIDWGADTYYIKTEIDLANGTNYSLTGDATQLLSVPYALHAKTADNVITHTAGDGIDITGNAIAVKPVSTGSGLTATVDGLKVKTDETIGSGLSVDATGLKVKTDETIGSGLSVDADGLKVKADANKGLTVDATDGLQVNAGDGLTSNSTDGLKVKTDETTGSGLSVDADGLKVKADANKGLTVDATDGLQVNAGDGLTSNSTDGLKVKLAAIKPGLAFDNNGGLKAATEPFYIGKDTLGGIVYYIYKDATGTQHGLIVNKGQSNGAAWQATGTLTEANRIDDGAFNTSKMTNSPAKTYVTGLGAGWYLPSISELNLLNNNIFIVNKVLREKGNLPLSAVFWSSTESSSSNAWYYYFKTVSSTSSNKSNTYRVRAIKAF